MHKIFIPVVDTDNYDFEYKGNLFTDEYFDQLNDNIKKVDNKINNYIRYGDRGNALYSEDEMTRLAEIDVRYKMHCVDAIVKDYYNYKDEINSNYLESKIKSNKHGLLIIDIAPNTVDFDCEEELKRWIVGTKKIMDDKEICDATKIFYLPKMTLELQHDDITYKLRDCKVAKIYKNRAKPFYFTIFIDKISY